MIVRSKVQWKNQVRIRVFENKTEKNVFTPSLQIKPATGVGRLEDFVELHEVW